MKTGHHNYYFLGSSLIAHLLAKYPPLFLGPEKMIAPRSFNFFIQRSMVFEGIFNAAAISTTLLPGFLRMNSKSRFIPSFAPPFNPSLVPSFIPPPLSVFPEL